MDFLERGANLFEPLHAVCFKLFLQGPTGVPEPIFPRVRGPLHYAQRRETMRAIRLAALLAALMCLLLAAPLALAQEYGGGDGKKPDVGVTFTPPSDRDHPCDRCGNQWKDESPTNGICDYCEHGVPKQPVEARVEMCPTCGKIYHDLDGNGKCDYCVPIQPTKTNFITRNIRTYLTTVKQEDTHAYERSLRIVKSMNPAAVSFVEARDRQTAAQMIAAMQMYDANILAQASAYTDAQIRAYLAALPVGPAVITPGLPVPPGATAMAFTRWIPSFWEIIGAVMLLVLIFGIVNGGLAAALRAAAQAWGRFLRVTMRTPNPPPVAGRVVVRGREVIYTDTGYYEQEWTPEVTTPPSPTPTPVPPPPGPGPTPPPMPPAP